MNIVKVTEDCALEREDVFAAPYQVEVLEYAMRSYGHLLILQPPREYTLDEFASMISQQQDTAAGSGRRFVVDTLHAVQLQTERFRATLH
jgi:hypothetical protein